MGLMAACSFNLSGAQYEYLSSQSGVNGVCKEIYHAQASQDEFVYALLYGMLNKNDKGTYLEIGAGPPVTINNTCILESLGWERLSIDIAADHAHEWSSVRRNPLLVADATQCDYSEILQSYPSVIDYLSLDVDGHYDVVLKRIPLDRYIFKIITIEHDFYRFGDLFKSKEREILSSYGYYLLCPDVTHPACGSFEDWWIHPSAFSTQDLSKLSSLDLSWKDHKQIVRAITALSGQ